MPSFICSSLYTRRVHIDSYLLRATALDPLRRLFVVGNVRSDGKKEPFPRVSEASRILTKDSRPPPLISSLLWCIDYYS